MRAPEPAAQDDPAWLVGHMVWRGLRLPVISYDALNGGSAQLPQDSRGRIAVLNTISDSHERLPFVALVTQGIPRLAKVEESLLQEVAEGDKGPADLMLVELEGQPLVIPNIEFLEKAAADAA